LSTQTVALAIGDPNGIGPEIAVKAAAALAAGHPRVVLVGDPFVIHSYATRFASGLTIRTITAGEDASSGSIDVLPVEALPREAFTPGRVDAAAGRATIAYVEAAFDFARAGGAAWVVACPHNATAVHAAGIRFSGYPSLVARLVGIPEDHVFLMLVSGKLRIVHVTLHQRLQDALASLTPELVEAAGEACIDALALLGIDRPRIGIFGINPHAGEGGLFGDDDERITVRAAERLRAAGAAIEGPVGADELIGRGLDAYVAMYHDQGHIPIKLLAGHTASALSIGAGVRFSSVAHGSAFDIAGHGSANPEALLRTLRLISGSATEPS
jgi:4-hydroxythreonine-4-phosphate dehydrogenase